MSSTRSTFENFEGLKGSKDKASRKMHPSDDFLQSLGITQRSDIEGIEQYFFKKNVMTQINF